MGKISFESSEAHNRFIEAARIAYAEGKCVGVTGIESLKTFLQYGDASYPISNIHNIKDFTIEVSKEDKVFEIETPNFGKQKIKFKLYSLIDKIVMETEGNHCFYIKISILEDNKVNVVCNIQPEKANTVEEVAKDCSIANEFIRYFFKDAIEVENKQDRDLIKKLNNCFEIAANHFIKLLKVQEVLGIEFVPALETDWDEKVQDIEELYLLLIQKKVLRLNAKLTCTEATGAVVENPLKIPEIGHSIDITFSSQYEYEICGQKFLVYTASLLTNAIIVSVEKREDGKYRIIYGDKDTEPMFISHSAFVTQEEANAEMKNIMNHVDDYKNAEGLEKYLYN